MRGVHGLCRRHATKEETVRLRGKWVQIDPRGWKRRMDLSVSVGLGTADQQMRMQGIQMLMMEQKQLAQAGIVQPKHFLASAQKMAEIVGFKNPDQFFGAKEEEGLPPEVQQALQAAQQEIQALQQALQEAQSGIAVKQIEVESRERIESAKMENALRIEEKRDDQKRDADELKAWLQLVLQRMQPNVDLSSEVAEDISEPESTEPQEEKPDPLALIAQAMQGMSAPKRKRMSIQAPSGQVYQGMIEDEQ